MRLLALAFCSLISTACLAAPTLQVQVSGLGTDGRIPPEFAFCTSDGAGKSKDAGNVNPALSWSGAPEGTKSYAVLVVDRDVPKTFELAYKEDKIIPESFPRQDFYHWVLVNIPASRTEIKQGEASSGLAKEGKPIGQTTLGLTGKNDYALFMKGSFGGYDGPCPPWNDARLHHYHFQVYALSVESVKLEGAFTGKQALAAIKPYILAQGEAVGTYSTRK